MVATTVGFDVASTELAGEGERLISWAWRDMPVLGQIRDRFARELPLQGMVVGACLHVTSETANLLITLKEGGATVNICASNPLSTNDAVAAGLAVNHGIGVYAIKGEDQDCYYRHIQSILATQPTMTMDDGADLVAELHKQRPSWMSGIIGGTEETTTGVIRLRALAASGKLEYPIVAVNDADTKHLFDNRYGTGQSTLDGVIRATNVLLAGKVVIVCGYGWCGRGIARRAQGLGARVVVTEVDPTRAIEAVMDGFDVAALEDRIADADLVITATGDIHVVRGEHMEKAKDGIILANSGHFNDELDLRYLTTHAKRIGAPRTSVEEFCLTSTGHTVYVLAEGRLVNLAAAEGHPASVMDMSFANQALAAEYLAQNHKTLGKTVVDVPPVIDREVARLKLATMGITIDTLTPEQVEYLQSWEMGTG